MTKLFLSPFDPAAPGSYRQRMQLLELVDAYEQARGDQTVAGMLQIARRINAAVLPRLHTDDGTPVDEALQQVSADEYDKLVEGVFATAGADSVPLASTPASTNGRAGKPARPSRRGRSSS